MPESLLPVKEAVDHLLLGVPVLEEGIAWLAEKTGIQAIPGGRHPGLGTHNALLSLGNKQYLEIIAPDPTQTSLAPQFAFLELATTPRLLTWAARTNHIEMLATQAHLANFELEGPRDGSRTRLDGTTLTWKTLFIRSEYSLLMPFFIEWGAASLHPSVDAPAGCSLQVFHLLSPAPQRFHAALRKLGIEATPQQAPQMGLQAILATPRGQVKLN